MASCRSTKYLKDGEYLYGGADINVIQPERIVNKSKIEKKILETLPVKNKPTLLRFGKPVSIYKSQYPNHIKSSLSKIYHDLGYFDATVSCDTIIENREINIACQINPGYRYTISKVHYLDDTLDISKTMRQLKQNEYIPENDYFDNDNIQKEKSALAQKSINSGYPYIKSKDIVVYLDTNRLEKKTDVYIRFKSQNDSIKYIRHRFGDLYINPGYSPDKDNPFDTTEMVKHKEYFIKSGYDFLNEKLINEAIFIKKGNIYNHQWSKIAVDRFFDYGLFKFVSLKSKRNKNNTIDQFINLTPSNTQSMTAEFQLNNRSGNFLGLLGKATYVNKNLWRGAQRFEISILGGAETQYVNDHFSLNTADATIEAKISMPSLRLFRTNRHYIPRTFVSLSGNRQKRIKLYDITSLKAEYGFSWHETHTKSYVFRPLVLNYLVTSGKSEKFDSILMSNPILAVAFVDQLVIGGKYQMFYIKTDKLNPNDQISFRGTLETVGNLLSLIKKTKKDQERATLFGTPYAQYIKLTADGRKYFPLGESTMAFRIFGGLGYAYGNSEKLPYSKQFSIGGSNSLRAYHLRTLGPGGYSPVDSTANQFLDQTGDLKLEANVEWRFPLFYYLKGAIFLDAGNIWTFDKDNRPEGAFNVRKFYNQIAIGTGLGFRLDFNFFVLRLDLAFPLRGPKKDTGFEWKLNKINFFKAGWRANNLVWNLGIGYPF